MTDTLESLAADFADPSRADWLKLVEKVLKGADFDKRLVSRTADGIAVQPLYTRDDAVEATPARRRRCAGNLGWSIQQLHVATDPETANKAILEDLEGGVSGLTVQLAADGQIGLAPTEAALTAALAGVHLDMVHVALAAGSHVMKGAAALAAVYRNRRVAPDQRDAALDADPIGALARLGRASRPVAADITAVARLATEDAWGPTRARVFLADGRTMHEAGGSEAQELAGMLASMVTYLEALDAVGIAPAQGLPRITVALAADADMFLTVAKLRAARRLIAQVAAACGADPAAADVRLTVTSSARMMARRDPWVNMLRTTSAAMAAGMGGADAITVLPFSWALGQPDAFARRIARNVQIIAQEESGLGRVDDPAAGSWYADQLTDALGRKAWELFQEIQGEGGIVAALQSGTLQDRVARVAAERDKAIATGRIPMTGVSTFPRLGDDGVSVTPWPSQPKPIGTPAATVAPLAPRRLPEPFERLRDRAEALSASGQPPRVFLASLGSLAEHTARTMYLRNFLAAGGIEALGGEGWTNSADVGAAFAASGATIACLCSSDAVYGELGEATAGVLKQAGGRYVYLAGRPGDEAALRAAGVDDFIFAGADAVALLSSLLDRLTASTR